MGTNRMLHPLDACLVPLALVVGCGPTSVVLSGDRTMVEVSCTQHPSPSTQHCYEVSAVWMQERYQLERSLRLRLERCEAERDGQRDLSMRLPEFGR